VHKDHKEKPVFKEILVTQVQLVQQVLQVQLAE
jgi:hypothetical protein